MRIIRHTIAGLMAILVSVLATGQDSYFQVSKRYPDSDNLAEKMFLHYSYLSSRYTMKGDLEGIELCSQLMSTLNYYNLEINTAIIKSQQGILDYYSNNNTAALSHYLKSLDIFTTTGYDQGIVTLLNNIAIIFARVDDYEMTFKYLNKALGFTSPDDIATKSLILLNIAETETYLKHYNHSLEIAKQLYEEYNINEAEFDIIAIIGIIIKNYNRLGEYDSALEWIDYVSDSMLTDVSVVDINSYCPNAMETYYNLKEYDKVLELGEMIYPPSVPDFLPDLYDALDILSAASREMNHYIMAMEYEEILRKIELSRTTVSREELIELLMTDYAFNRDNLARTSLERELYLNREKQRALRKFLIVFLIGIIVVSISTLVMIRIRRIRIILRKELTDENSKLALVNRQLSASNRLMEKENSLLDTLISVFAHDLINPFQAILGFSKLMISDYDSIDEENIREYSSMLSDTSFQLNQLLTNLRNMAVLQDENRHLESSLFAIDPVLYEIITLFTPAAMKKNIVIEYRGGGNLNGFINPDIFQSVIRNALSNAVKFSHENSRIEFGSFDSEGMTAVTIKDYGTGMSADTRKKLLSKEFLKSNPGTMKEKGSGLGLTICIELLELYNGRLQIESKKDEGSLITVYIPGNHG